MLKAVGWLAVALAGTLFPLAVLAAYDVTGSSPPEPFHTGSLEGATTTIDIHPDPLHLKSEGQPVTAYVELPQGLDVGNIDVGTVRLCLGQVTACSEEASIHAEDDPTGVGDHDGDTIPDRMVKFGRGELIELLGGQTGHIAMTVAGMVTPPGQPFAGSDTIRVIDRGCGRQHDDTCAEEEPPEDAPPPTAEAPQATPESPLATPEAPLPTPEAPPPAPAVPTFGYQVQPGDTLFDIALRFGTSVEALVELNGLTTAQVVWAGQVLKVAGAAPPTPPPPPSPPPPPTAATVEYTVRPGENVSDVASFFGTTVEAIVALNGLTDANLVAPGQRLLVPAPPANTAPGQAFMSEYVVQPGETLTDIAVRFGTTVEALAAENNLANPSAIRIGDRLRVP